MRHEKIAIPHSRDIAGMAAVWPVTAQIAPVPIPEPEPEHAERSFTPTPAAPDVPAGVGAMIVAAYTLLIAAFAAATIRSADSVFILGVVIVFIAAFFTVPGLFFAVEPKASPRVSFDRFMDQGIDTFTGRCSGGAALVQMLIVPVFLTLGVIAMGIAIAVIF